MRQNQRTEPAFNAHGLGACAKRRCNPRAITAGGYVFNPARKASQGVARQTQQIMTGRFLICHPPVEQLLHGPGSLTKLIEPHHPRAAFEGVENAPQNRQLVDIAGVSTQQAHRLQPIARNFPGFFQKNIAQIVFFKVNFFNPIGRDASSRRGSDDKCAQCGGGGLGIVNRHRGGCILRSLSQHWLTRQSRVSGEVIELEAQRTIGCTGSSNLHQCRDLL